MAAGAPDLAGSWSGGRHILKVGATGATLETDCADAAFGPVRPDAQGRFHAEGTWFAHAAGPQPAPDAAPAGRPAVLSGQLADADGARQLELVLKVEGAPPETLVLVPGVKVKLIACR